ncbi:MAG TPA: SpoIIE family protein phosphatase [Kofleriaceae bacterium]|nr:SpoIIE family protein phosphatase [Kofleriaceae bacterium]
MKLRTTVFLWVLLLVLAVLGSTIAAIATVLDRSARQRVAADLAGAREVTLDLHADRQSLYRQECRVVADEPRLRAVVATEDVARETIVDSVASLAATVRAGAFVIVDADGRLIVDHADPGAAGFDLSDRPVVRRALDDGEAAGVWVTDDAVYQVQGCRLEFGARVVGVLVIGHAIGDPEADTIARHTAGALIVAVDGAAITRVPAGIARDGVADMIARVRRGEREVSAGGTHWFAQLLPVPGYRGEHAVEYLLLRSIDEALAPAHRVLQILFALVGAAALATLLTALLLARRIARPIDALVARTQAIARGDLAARTVHGPREVESLGDAMNRMAEEIGASREALADRERLARELEIAARIQVSILPREIDVAGLELSARMQTASEVGGDYYDVLPVERGCWIAIGDVSGHGLTAGLVMMMVQTGIASLVRSQPDANPRDLVRTLNRVVYENLHDRLEARRHMTLSVMRYRPDGRMVVAGAHMDAVVWRAATGTIELLATPGTFLAVAQDIDQVNVDVDWQIDPGDVVVLLSDGVTEAEDASRRQFGYDGVTRILQRHAHTSVEAIRDAMFAAVREHSPELADDATVLVMRRAVSP